MSNTPITPVSPVTQLKKSPQEWLQDARKKLVTPDTIYDLKDKAFYVTKALEAAVEAKLSTHSDDVQFIQSYLAEYVAKIENTYRVFQESITLAEQIKQSINNGTATKDTLVPQLEKLIQAKDLYQFYNTNVKNFRELFNQINSNSFYQEMFDAGKLQALGELTKPDALNMSSISELTDLIYNHFNHKIELESKTEEGIREYLTTLEVLLDMEAELSDFDFVDRLFADHETQKILQDNPELSQKAKALNTKLAFHLSQQLTNTGIQLFKNITEEELLSVLSHNDPNVCKNITAYSRFNDQLTLLVNKSIYSSADPNCALVALERWIAVAYTSFQHNDFNASTAIMAALNNSPLLYERNKEQLIPVSLFHKLSPAARSHLKELEVLTEQALISRRRKDTKLSGSKEKSEETSKEKVSDKFKLIWEDKAEVVLPPLNTYLADMFFANQSKKSGENLQSIPLAQDTLARVAKMQTAVSNSSEKRNAYSGLTSILTATKLRDFDVNADKTQSQMRSDIIQNFNKSVESLKVNAFVDFYALDNVLQINQKILLNRVDQLAIPSDISQVTFFYDTLREIVATYYTDKAYLAEYALAAPAVVSEIEKGYEEIVKKVVEKSKQFKQFKNQLADTLAILAEQSEAAKNSLDRAGALAAKAQKTPGENLEIYQILNNAADCLKDLDGYQKLADISKIEPIDDTFAEAVDGFDLSYTQKDRQQIAAHYTFIENTAKYFSGKLTDKKLHALVDSLDNNFKLIVNANNELERVAMSGGVGAKGVSAETLAAFDRILTHIEKSIQQSTPDFDLYYKLLATEWAQNVLDKNIVKELTSLLKGESANKLNDLRKRTKIINTQLIDGYAKNIAFESAKLMLNITSADIVYADKSGLSPNFAAMRNYSQNIAGLMEKDILADNNPNVVVLKVDHWVKIIDKLYQQGDFNDAITCLMQLTSGAVSKLLDHSSAVLPKETTKILEKLQPLVKENIATFKHVREAMAVKQGPMIPFMALFAKDITGLRENANANIESYLNQALTLVQKSQASLMPVINKNLSTDTSELFLAATSFGKDFDVQQRMQKIGGELALSVVLANNVADVDSYNKADVILLDSVNQVVGYHPTASINPTLSDTIVKSINQLPKQNFASTKSQTYALSQAATAEQTLIKESIAAATGVQLSQEQAEYVRLDVVRKQSKIDYHWDKLISKIEQAINSINKSVEGRGAELQKMTNVLKETLAPGAVINLFTSVEYINSLQTAQTKQRLEYCLDLPVNKVKEAGNQLNTIVERIAKIVDTSEIDEAKKSYLDVLSNWQSQCQQYSLPLNIERQLALKGHDDKSMIDLHAEQVTSIQNKVLFDLLSKPEQTNVYLTDTAILQKFNDLLLTTTKPANEFEQVWFLLKELGVNPNHQVVQKIADENKSIREKLSKISNQEFVQAVTKEADLAQILSRMDNNIFGQINGLNFIDKGTIENALKQLGLNELTQNDIDKVYLASCALYCSMQVSQLNQKLETGGALDSQSIHKHFKALRENYAKVFADSRLFDMAGKDLNINALEQFSDDPSYNRLMDYVEFLNEVPNFISPELVDAKLQQRPAVLRVAERFSDKSLQNLFKSSIAEVNAESEFTSQQAQEMASAITSLASNGSTDEKTIQQYVEKNNIVVKADFYEKFIKAKTEICAKIALENDMSKDTAKLVDKFVNLNIDNWQEIISADNISSYERNPWKKLFKLPTEIKKIAAYVKPIRVVLAEVILFEKNVMKHLGPGTGADDLIPKMLQLFDTTHLTLSEAEALQRNMNSISELMYECDSFSHQGVGEAKYPETYMGISGENGNVLISFMGITGLCLSYLKSIDTAEHTLQDVNIYKNTVAANIDNVLKQNAPDYSLVQQTISTISRDISLNKELAQSIDQALAGLEAGINPYINPKDQSCSDPKALAQYKIAKAKLENEKAYLITVAESLASLQAQYIQEHPVQAPQETAIEEIVASNTQLQEEVQVEAEETVNNVEVINENPLDPVAAIQEEYKELLRAIANSCLTSGEKFPQVFEPLFAQFKKINNHINTETLDELRNQVVAEVAPEIWNNYYLVQIGHREKIIDKTLRAAFDEKLQIALKFNGITGDITDLNTLSVSAKLKPNNLNKILQEFGDVKLSPAEFKTFKTDSQLRWLNINKVTVDQSLVTELEQAASQARGAWKARMLNKVFGKETLDKVGSFLQVAANFENLDKIKQTLEVIIDLKSANQSNIDLSVADLKVALNNIKVVLSEEKESRQFFELKSAQIQKREAKKAKFYADEDVAEEMKPLLETPVIHKNKELSFEGNLEFKAVSGEPVLSQPEEAFKGGRKRANAVSFTQEILSRLSDQAYLENKNINIDKIPTPQVIGNSIKFREIPTLEVKEDGTFVLGKDKNGRIKEDDADITMVMIKAVKGNLPLEITFTSQADVNKNFEKIATTILAVDQNIKFKYRVKGETEFKTLDDYKKSQKGSPLKFLGKGKSFDKKVAEKREELLEKRLIVDPAAQQQLGAIQIFARHLK